MRKIKSRKDSNKERENKDKRSKCVCLWWNKGFRKILYFRIWYIHIFSRVINNIIVKHFIHRFEHEQLMAKIASPFFWRIQIRIDIYFVWDTLHLLVFLYCHSFHDYLSVHHWTIYLIHFLCCFRLVYHIFINIFFLPLTLHCVIIIILVISRIFLVISFFRK